MVDRYNLTADTYDSVLLDWSQNPEAIEFFERCGKYLSVEQNPIIPRLSEYTRVSRLAISRVDESESTS